jgi:Ca2+-binding EF-hand superfamily protein
MAAAADKPFSTAKVEELLEVFKEFDSDGSGQIDGTELHGLLTKMGGTITLVKAQAMIDEVDPNGDGTIDFMEFMNLVQEDQKNGGKSTGFMNVVKVLHLTTP